MGMFIHRRKVTARQVADSRQSVKVEEPKAVEKPESKLTKAEIEKLPFFTLRSMAQSYGVETKNKKKEQIIEELLKKIGEEK